MADIAKDANTHIAVIVLRIAKLVKTTCVLVAATAIGRAMAARRRFARSAGLNAMNATTETVLVVCTTASNAERVSVVQMIERAIIFAM